MCFRYRFFLSLCFALVLVSEVEAANETFVARNRSGGVASYRTEYQNSGNWYHIISDIIIDGADAQYAIDVNPLLCRTMWVAGSGGVNAANATQIDEYSTGDGGTYTSTFNGSVPQTTNSWCVYNVNWVNLSSNLKYAQLQGYYDYGDHISELSFRVGTDLYADFVAVRPGDTFSQMITNSIGTNSYACPSLVLYDARLGDDAPISTVGGTKYSNTTGGNPSGSGDHSVLQGPIMSNQPTNYTSTNYQSAPIRQDLFNLGDLFTRALSEVENSIHQADMVSRTNFNQVNQNLSNINTNLGSKLDGIGTNILGLSTNLVGVGTNMAKIGGILEGQTNAAYLAMSNMLATAQTNVTWADVSNWVGEASGSIGTFQSLLPMNDIRNQFSSGFAEVAPASDFGVLEPTIGGVSVFRMDIKEALHGEVFEQYMAGFWQWVNALLLWGALVWAMKAYGTDLRDAVVDAMKVNESASASKFLSTLGTLLGGPAGYGMGRLVGTVLSLGGILVVVTCCVFLISIVLVAAQTLVTGLNVVTITTTALAGPGSAIGNFVELVPLSFKTLIFIGLNYAFAKFTLDGAVAVICIFLKTRPV